MTMEYTLIRSGRRTVSVEVKPDGSLVVRAPYRLPQRKIDSFLREKEEWILKTREKVLKRREEAENTETFSEKELETLKNEARQKIPFLVEEYAKEMGLSYNRISIRAQKTRWGSCSREKNLNFNCLLMLTPESVQRYVVVHELCHLWEMNHSDRFWAHVADYCPDWKEQRKWLKRNGGALIDRLPEEG